MCDYKQLYNSIIQIPKVANAKVFNNGIEVDINGTEDDCAYMLTSLVKQGYKIIEVRHIKAGLEDIFMSITKGELS